MSLRILLSVALLLIGPASRAETVTVFAAASTTNAVNEIAALFSARGLGEVRASYAASSTLARQIEHGAPAQLFISADGKWMDYLAQRGLIDPASRTDLLGNRLVVIAPADSPLSASRIEDLPRLLGDGRLALGDPDHVPVGLYAREALERLGHWQALSPRLARADSVRAALAMVERGEAPLGIVYSTDARVSGKVKVVAEFPQHLHQPVVYPMALVAGQGGGAARALLDLLRGAEARAIFIGHGFTMK